MPDDPALRDRLTGLILAGGRARRMGGEDKGLLPYQGRPLIEHAIERLHPQAGALAINANRSRAAYARFGFPVVADAEAGFLGPLAGMLAGLRFAATEFVLCAPCDCPRIAPDLGARLAAALKDSGAPIAAAACAGRLQPVFALLRRDLAGPLAEFLDAGGRKIDRFYERQSFEEVPFDDPDAFRNINTPEELAA